MHEVITRRTPVSVALNGPDGILPQVQSAARGITTKFGIPAYVLADTTWGSCDLNYGGFKTLGAGILFNIGHTINTEELEGGDVVMINAFDNISFEKVAAKCAQMLCGKTVSLLTDSQHLLEIDSVRETLTCGGLKVILGKGGGQLNEAQVFGCEFYPATDSVSKVDANVFMGQSAFHASGVALATGLDTYILDPYFGEVHNVTEFAKKLQRRATAAIYKAAEGESFGIIVGLKDGQLSKVTALRIKRELEAEGKHVQLFGLTNITADRLESLSGIDAFIQVACPRISTDNPFPKPVLSVPQSKALLRIIRGEELGEYFQTPHWL